LIRAASAWLLVVGLVTTPAALAHSLLLEASPAPDRVTLRFNNRIEKKLSRLTLVSERGSTRPLALTLGGAPDQLGAPLPPLDAGQWRLDWSVLSTDGHLVTGRYSFRVLQ
jgi:methionine-rich copper-binding protein CopC